MTSDLWSAARDDFDDFEAVAGLESALGEFGGSDGFTVEFDDDAAGEEVLGNQELIQRTRKVALDAAVIGDDEGHLSLKR